MIFDYLPSNRQVKVNLYYHYDNNTKCQRQPNTLIVSNNFMHRVNLNKSDIIDPSNYAFAAGSPNIYRWGFTIGVNTSKLVSKMITTVNNNTITFMPLIDKSVRAKADTIAIWNLTLGLQLTNYCMEHNIELLLADRNEKLAVNAHHNVINLKKLLLMATDVVKSQVQGDHCLEFGGSGNPVLLSFRDDEIGDRMDKKWLNKHKGHRIKVNVVKRWVSYDTNEFEQSIVSIINTASVFKALVSAHGKSSISKVYFILDPSNAYTYAIAILLLALSKTRPDITSNVIIVQMYKNGRSVERTFESLLV